MSGKPWYNNGEIEIQVGSNEVVPNGFVRGRKPLTQEERNGRTLKYLNTVSAKSDEEKDIANKKRSASLRLAYASKSDEQKASTIEKRMNSMNSKSEEEKDLYRKRLSDATKGKNIGKIPWNKGLTKDTDVRVAMNAEHTSKSMSQKAKDILNDDPEYFSRWRKNLGDTLRANGTFNTSYQEESYYKELCDKYGKDNVIRQYSDSRYPFACDFYIPSEDLFIEFNRTWTHGGHPFDPMSLDDISKLESWQEKSKTSNYYKNAIYTWTDLDVRKQKMAKDNNLNYKTIY